MKQMVKHAIVGIKANVHWTINVWPVKLKSKPAVASMNYLLKFILLLVRQNLSPGTTTIQYHLETGHTKMIPNF